MDSIRVDDIVEKLIEQTKNGVIQWEVNSDFAKNEFDNSASFIDGVQVNVIYFAEHKGTKFFIIENVWKKKNYVDLVLSTQTNGNLLYGEDKFDNKSLLRRLINIIIRNGKDEKDILNDVYNNLLNNK